MKVRSRSNVLLVELLIVVMFFMLASCTLLQVFAAASGESRRAEEIARAAADAQNIADQVYVSEDIPALMEKLAFREDDGCWLREDEDYQIRVTAEELLRPAGIWLAREISVIAQDGEVMVCLPCSRYQEVPQ